MEYMLLKDGSFKTFDPIEQTERIRSLLKFHDGIAYYWQMSDGGWYCVERDEVSKRSQIVKEVPDIIKLAAMLQ